MKEKLVMHKLWLMDSLMLQTIKLQWFAMSDTHKNTAFRLSKCALIRTS